VFRTSRRYSGTGAVMKGGAESTKFSETYHPIGAFYLFTGITFSNLLISLIHIFSHFLGLPVFLLVL